MPVIPEGIAYAYTHETTQATTGYFSCQPPASLTLPQALARTIQPLVNIFIACLIGSSLAAASGVVELTAVTQRINQE